MWWVTRVMTDWYALTNEGEAQCSDSGLISSWKSHWGVISIEGMKQNSCLSQQRKIIIYYIIKDDYPIKFQPYDDHDKTWKKKSKHIKILLEQPYSFTLIYRQIISEL